jgi:hypothetical protein
MSVSLSSRRDQVPFPSKLLSQVQVPVLGHIPIAWTPHTSPARLLPARGIPIAPLADWRYDRYAFFTHIAPAREMDRWTMSEDKPASAQPP